RSGTNFAAPATNAGSFIGYYDVTNKQTVCGSCHVDYQTRWSATKHAGAWADLQASGVATGVCQACHSVTNLGNAVTDTAVGYRSTKDARYHDVQCESCHGPGLTHASDPNANNLPLASIKADTNATNGCGECHTGVHEPFVDEWKLTNVSGLSHSIVQSGTVGNTDPTCVGCHTAQGALLQFGVTENYVESVASSAAITTANALPIVCATCHDPHGSSNAHQLRFSISAANIDDNLCIKCHQRRADPSQVTTRNSVHSPEGPTLLGLAGWFPPGMSAGDSIIGTHGTPSANPELCATCHVYRYTAVDSASGNFVFQSTGHRFIAAPCVDANGIPTTAQTCDISVKTFRSCVASGCHASETVARSLYLTDSARILQLVTSLNSAINKVNAIKPGDCKLGGPIYTSCLGSQFNVTLAQSPGGFVHNPFLLEQLLIASINQLQKDYGVTPSVSVSLKPQFILPRRKAANGALRQ
ncbi:MAG TPA: cytochrome c3 family protein, partial [Gemmatimonadaceae bacterium]|nr:cytochrome c3 family protein [Gemmatimonadaceae bacterium]